MEHEPSLLSGEVASQARDGSTPTPLQRVLADNIHQLVWRHHDKSTAARRSRRAGADKSERRPSLNAWATSHELDDKIMHRVLGPRSITIVTLEHIARSEGLEPWQLLVPKLNPESPPPIASEFSVLAIDLARALDKIKDAVLREKCYALAIRRIEMEIEDGDSGATPNQRS